MHTDAHPSTLSSIPANGDKVAQKIYQQLSGVNPCVLLTNATHQIGCTCKLLSWLNVPIGWVRGQDKKIVGIWTEFTSGKNMRVDAPSPLASVPLPF